MPRQFFNRPSCTSQIVRWFAASAAMFATACTPPAGRQPVQSSHADATSREQDVLAKSSDELLADPNLQDSAGSKGDGRVESVRLGTVRSVKLTQPITASAEEAEDIQQLVGKLAAIESPDFGLSGTLTGDAFLPIEGKTDFSAGLITDHRLKSSDELRKLVAYGPKALPFLLAALDDNTKTKLKMEHGGGFGGMTFENEMSGNPVNAREQLVLAGKAEGHERTQHVNEYTVTVGDVCFVAIGQIVGRWYNAVRYQPTNNIILSSPAHDAKLREMVRAIWASDDAGQTLLDSLLLDYATEGIFNGHSLDGWDVGGRLQSTAAMRLLYYYPKESAGFIAQRIDKLDLTPTEPDKDDLGLYMKQCVANGVRADGFIEAIAWCDEPAILAALSRAFERAGDLSVALATEPAAAKSKPELVRTTLAKRIGELPEDDKGPYADGYALLVALGKLGGDQAKRAFEQYSTPLTTSRRHTTCLALREVRGEWAIDLLAPFLNDRRELDRWTYAVDFAQNERRLPIRICDEAATTIALANEDLKFEMQGDRARLDFQIQAMQSVLKMK